MPRAQATAASRRAGASVPGSVSSTDILVAGRGAGSSKLKAAEVKGVEVWMCFRGKITTL